MGDIIFNEAADYEVKIEMTPGVSVFTSAGEDANQIDRETAISFPVDALRDFAIIAGRSSYAEENGGRRHDAAINFSS